MNPAAERTFVETLLRLRRSVKLGRAELESGRLQRFRALVAHAQRSSRYYASIMAERGLDVGSCVPSDFPVLTKHLLAERFDDLVTDPRVRRASLVEFLGRSRSFAERYLDELVVLHTSGSSGEVGIVVYGELDWVRGFAGAARLNDLRGRNRVAFYGAAGGHYAGVSTSGMGSAVLGHAIYDFAAVEINAPLDGALARLEAFQPRTLVGYATGLTQLAAARQAGRLAIHPEVVHSGGEPLAPDEQGELEDAFGCPCVNTYVTTEGLLMGYARRGDPGITLFDDDLILEPASDHLLVTNLFNFTLPLIRYRLDDTLRLTDQKSPHGPYPVVEAIVGRNEMVPTFRNLAGELDFISPIVISEIFVPGVRRMQLRLRSESAFRFAVCLERALDADGRAAAVEAMHLRLREILGQKQLSNVGFEIVVEERIPVDPMTGKYRLVVRDG